MVTFDYADVYDEALREVILPHPDRYCVEIGAWKGDSTLHIAKALMHSRLAGNLIPEFYTIDTWAGSPNEPALMAEMAKVNGDMFPTFWERMKAERVDSVIYPIQRDSVKASVMFPTHSCGFVFLDGGHTYEQVIADFTAWHPLVVPGGVLAGHDYDWAEVRLAVRALLKAYSHVRFSVKGRCWWLQL